jgi:transposase
MAGGSKDVLDIQEMIRRFRLGQSDRAIGRDTAIDRKTVGAWRDWAEGQGFLDGEAMPDEIAIADRLKATAPEATGGPPLSVEKWRELVIAKREEGVELTALLRILREHDFKGSNSALRRFVARIEKRAPEVFARVETAPGEEAQVDFFYAGLIADETGRLRKTWVFEMTVSWSRHLYVEAVFDQKIETWFGLHVRALVWFGGLLRKIKFDNLKAGIVEAVMHDPVAQRSHQDLATHYGFLISPCRPKTPQHKGKVESDAHYVERNALAGRTFANLRALNEYLCRWAMDVAGVRDHGTTHERPLDRFEKEKAKLLPLPAAPYEISTWKKAKVHTDGHVVLDGSYYSAPSADSVMCEAVTLNKRRWRQKEAEGGPA